MSKKDISTIILVLCLFLIFLALPIFGPKIRKATDSKTSQEVISKEDGYVGVAFIISRDTKAEEEKMIEDAYMCARKTKFEVTEAQKQRAETMQRIQEIERDLKQLKIGFEKEDVNPSEYDYVVFLSKGEEDRVEKREGNKLWITYTHEPLILLNKLREWCGLEMPIEGLRVISKH